jgi:hypothetical protein
MMSGGGGINNGHPVGIVMGGGGGGGGGRTSIGGCIGEEQVSTRLAAGWKHNFSRTTINVSFFTNATKSPPGIWKPSFFFLSSIPFSNFVWASGFGPSCFFLFLLSQPSLKKNIFSSFIDILLFYAT